MLRPDRSPNKTLKPEDGSCFSSNDHHLKANVRYVPESRPCMTGFLRVCLSISNLVMPLRIDFEGTNEGSELLNHSPSHPYCTQLEQFLRGQKDGAMGSVGLYKITNPPNFHLPLTSELQ